MGGNTSQKQNITPQLGAQGWNPFLPMQEGPKTSAGIYDPPPFVPEQEHDDLTSEELAAIGFSPTQRPSF